MAKRLALLKPGLVKDEQLEGHDCFLALSATMSEVVGCFSGGQRRPNKAWEAKLLQGGFRSQYVKESHFCADLLFGQQLLLVTWSRRYFKM